MTITAEILIALALGLVVCFFGYKLKKLAFAIAWFLIGYTLCSHFAPDIIAWMPQLENPDLWMGVLPIAVGLLAALMGLTIERLCIAALAYIVVVTIAIQQFGASFPIFAVASIVGVIAGCVAVSLMKPAIIILTAIAGAQSISTAIVSLFSLNAATLYLPILVIAAVVGAIFQFKNNKHSA